MVSEVICSMKKRGIFSTIELLLGEFIFDYKYNTDTFGQKKLSELTDIVSPNSQYGVDYQGANYFLTRRLFNEIKSMGLQHLVDYGSGKGRVMVLALNFGFAKVEGIEFSNELAQSSIKNLSNRKSTFNSGQSFNIVIGDAIDFAIPNTADTFFFYNPFSCELFEKVITNISNSYKKAKRKIIVIYVNPICQQILKDRGFKVLRIFGRKENPEAIIFEYVD